MILPNALLGREVYPFLFQERASASALARTMRQVLSDAEAGRRAANDAEDLRKMLRGGAGSFEAGVVEAMADWLGPPSR